MEESQEQVPWNALETRLMGWHATTVDVHQVLTGRLAETREQVERLMHDLEAHRDTASEAAREAIAMFQEARRAAAQQTEGGVADLRRALAEREETLERLRTEARDLHLAVSQRDEAAQRTLEEASELESRAARAEAALAEATSRADGAEARVAALEQELGQLREACQHEMTERERFERMLAERDAELEGEHGRVARVEDTLRDRDGAVAILERRTVDLEQALAASHEAVRQAEGRVAESHRHIEEHSTEHLRQVSALSERIETLERDLNAARTDAAGLHDRMGSLDELRQAYEQACHALAGERDRAEALAEQLREETQDGTKASLARQLAQALQDNEGLRNQMLALRRDARQARSAETEGGGDGRGGRPDTGPLAIGRRTKLGEHLLLMGAVTEEALDEALEEQRSTPHRHLGAILVERGVDEEQVARALAQQGQVEFVCLEDYVIDPEVACLITPKMAVLHSCVPVRATRTTITLAMANPFDLVAISDVERASQRRAEFVVATQSDIRGTVQRVYGSAVPA